MAFKRPTLEDRYKIKIKSLDGIVDELQQALKKDKKLDKLRERRFDSTKAELLEIKDSIEHGQVQVGLDHEKILNSALKKVAEIKGEQPVLLPIKEITKAELEAQLVKKPVPETEVERIMREFNVKREFAEKLVRKPEATLKEAEAELHKTIREMEARKAEEIKKKAKRRRLRG